MAMATTDAAIAVLHEDDAILAVAKPGGVAVHRAHHPSEGRHDGPLEAGWPDVLTLMRQHRPSLPFLAAAHRLDAAATGVLLLAKHPEAARRLCRQFADRLVQKWYWAITENPPAEPAATLIDWLLPLERPPYARWTSQTSPAAVEAILHYWRLANTPDGALLAIQLSTGRPRQIRAQLAARGCPIRGDADFGAQTSWRDGAIALHARRLGFFHPSDNAWMILTADPPACWPPQAVSAGGALPRADQPSSRE